MAVSPDRSVCPNFVDYSYFEQGYNLSAGQSVTLAFNGQVKLGFGTFIENVIAGNSYKLVVQGERDARASTNVTAAS